MTAASESGLRADARRNRDQIVAAATRLFARGGVDTPMEEIARAASVGVGTLYRRFPDRDALIIAVARESFGVVRERVEAARAEEPTAWGAVERILRHAVDLRLTSQLLSSHWAQAGLIRADAETSRSLDRIMTILDQTVADAQAEGSMRADVALGDILLLYTGIVARSSVLAEDVVDIATDRGLSIMLDGLRPAGSGELPGKAMTPYDLGVGRRRSRDRKRAR